MTQIAIKQNNQDSSWLEQAFSLVNPYHNLELRMREIAAKNLLSVQDKEDLKFAFKLAYRWTWPAGRMRSLLKDMPKEQIHELVADLLMRGKENEIPIELANYLNLINQATLLDLSDLKTAEKAASWFHSRGLIKNLKLKNRLEKEGRAIVREFLIEAKYFLYHLLELLISLLGINVLAERKPTKWSSDDRVSEWEAISKLEAYGKLIGIPTVIFGVIYTYIELKAAALALTTAAVASLVIFLVAYERYLKPCPKDCYGLTNLTLEMLHSKEQIFVRQDILRKIERAFKEKKGVLLVGEPGAGKSWIPRSLVQQMREGKICTFIKDPQVFTTGASKFKGYDSPSLDSITERFKNYCEQVVFFFDEFQAFFKTDGQQRGNKADEIKMFCEDFKFVIGATTTVEYNKFIKKQPAIKDRRFIVVKVGQLAVKSIKIILSQFLQVHYPALSLDVKTLDYIILKAKEFNPNTSKIDAAQTLLNCAIKEMETIEFKSLESKIDKSEAEIKLLEQELIHAKPGEDDAIIKKLKAKQVEAVRQKGQLKKKNQQVKRLKKIEAYHLSLTEKSLRMADPTVKLVKNSALEREWLVLQSSIKEIGDFIEKERAKLSLPSRLDCQLIDKIIKERKG